jgi:hypothetical protein
MPRNKMAGALSAIPSVDDDERLVSSLVDVDGNGGVVTNRSGCITSPAVCGTYVNVTNCVSPGNIAPDGCEHKNGLSIVPDIGDDDDTAVIPPAIIHTIVS